MPDYSQKFLESTTPDMNSINLITGLLTMNSSNP
jgi:hypothetical protein